MLTPKNKAFLKKVAHSSNILKINIGKELIDDNVITSINNAFNTHELIKISFLKTAVDKTSKNELAIKLVEKLKNVDIVQQIGNTIILYRENKEIKDHLVF